MVDKLMMCCSNVEDQDSSGEDGLSSNWWVLGSQGRDPLSTSGDATLQTLSQSALSPLGTQNTQKQSRQVENEHESAVKNSDQSYLESREASDEQRNGNNEKQSDVEAPSGKNQVMEEGEKREHKQYGENESGSNDEGIPFRRLRFPSCTSFVLKTTRPSQMQNRKRNTVDEYYERAASLRTQNSFIQTTRATRTSWRNGPTLRQCMRLPAHRPIHPLQTLIRKTETQTTGRKRRTQTKIGFYRALAKGKINVRVSIRSARKMYHLFSVNFICFLKICFL